MAPETGQEIQSGADIGFQLDAPELTLKQLATIASDFQGLFKDVQASALPSGRVRWRISRISMGSPLELALRAVSDSPEATPARLSELSDSITTGLKLLQDKPERPRHFGDRALESTRELVVALRGIGATLSVDSLRLDDRVVANIAEVLGIIRTEIGSVEGHLEALNVHGPTRYFNVYDVLTGERIKCDFAHRIPAATVGAAAERRVIVRGEIDYRDNGQIVKVLARDLEVLPLDEELPSADAVLGILGN